MQITKKDLPKKQVELTIELTVEEMKPFVNEAVEEISKSKNIAGFRPGKAPYDVVVKEVGEMEVYQTAANRAIAKSYYEAIEKENLETVDQPAVEVLKLAPGNPFSYKATVALMPNVELCEYDKIKVKPLEKITVDDKDLEKTIEDLRNVRGKEVLDEKAAEKGDRVDLDFDTFMDKVAIDRGQAKGHKLVIGEDRMIPGFEDNVVGMKKGDEKEFELAFPKEYHAKELAGKKATFKIKVNGIYKIELPELNDEFAKSLGLKNVEDLKGNIRNNLQQEKEAKAKQAQEVELIEALIEKCTFGELADVLVDQETHKMMHELEENLTRQGMNVKDYLEHMKKTEADLKLDFVPDAIKRVKTALVVREIAKKENVKATDEEINQELEKTLASYKMNPAYEGKLDELEQNLKSDNAKQYFQNLITNRKTIEKLKSLIVK